MPHSQILLCVVAGLLVGRNSASSPDVSLMRLSGHYPMLKLAFVVIAMLAVVTTTMLGTAYLRTVKDVGPNVLRGNPHFWNYGRFNAW